MYRLWHNLLINCEELASSLPNMSHSTSAHEHSDKLK